MTKKSLKDFRRLPGWAKAIVVRMPRRRHLRDTWLHRQLGERIFHPNLWRPTRHGIAGGLAVGVFVAMTPTIGIQMVLACLAAYFLRVNIPIAIAACWITNPATIPIIYPLQFQLGKALVGVPDPEELRHYQGIVRGFYHYARPMFVGSLIPSIVLSALSYVITYGLWNLIGKLVRRKNKPISATDVAPPRGRDTLDF